MNNGHCVNGRRTVLSFKNKRVVRKAEDEWIVVENVFPPLITERLWNDAHERLKTRKHESTNDFVNLFAGLLKCGHCGKGLGLSNTKDHSNYYACNTYKKKSPAKCTNHYLPYDDLYGLVLTEVQRALIAVRANRESFIQSVQAKLNAGDESRRHPVVRRAGSHRPNTERPRRQRTAGGGFLRHGGWRAGCGGRPPRTRGKNKLF